MSDYMHENGNSGGGIQEERGFGNGGEQIKECM